MSIEAIKKLIWAVRAWLWIRRNPHVEPSTRTVEPPQIKGALPATRSVSEIRERIEIENANIERMRKSIQQQEIHMETVAVEDVIATRTAFRYFKRKTLEEMAQAIAFRDALHWVLGEEDPADKI